MKCNEDMLRELSQLIMTVFRVNGRIVEWGDLLGGKLGLTSSRWQILGAIRLAEGPLTSPQISRIIGVTRQAVQKQLNVMLAEGLVRKLHNPHNDRSYLYDLTDEGRDITYRIRNLYAEWGDEVVGSMDAAEIKNLRETLDALSARIEGIVIYKNGKTELRPKIR